MMKGGDKKGKDILFVQKSGCLVIWFYETVVSREGARK